MFCFLEFKARGMYCFVGQRGCTVSDLKERTGMNDILLRRLENGVKLQLQSLFVETLH